MGSTLDLDRNGSLDHAELSTPAFIECIRDCLGEHFPDMSSVGEIVDFLLGRTDGDDNSTLSRKEFFEFTWRLKHITSEDADLDADADLVFALFDPNKDGKIDSTEFERLFNFYSHGGGRASSKEF